MARRRADDLPARVEVHGDRHYYRPGALGRKAGEPRITIPLGSDLEAVRAQAIAIEKRLRARARGPVRRQIANLLHMAKHRAKAQGVPFTITYEDVAALLERGRGLCAISKLPFSSHRGTYRASPWAMSLDRRRPKLGYVKGNVRLVCLIVNVALNEWGLSVLRQMSKAVASDASSLAISLNVPENSPKPAEWPT